jgi:hypothetical protein
MWICFACYPLTLALSREERGEIVNVLSRQGRGK